MTDSSNIKFIPLTQGQFAIVDADDYDWLNQWIWSLVKRPGIVNVLYAQRSLKLDNGGYGIMLMHTAIMPPPQGMMVDHRNTYGLDNRLCNLRICNKMQNAHNCPKRRKGTSKYKGVHFSKDTNKWHAYINFNKKRTHIGCFKTEDEAAAARNVYELEYYKEFARPNIIEGDKQ